MDERIVLLYGVIALGLIFPLILVATAVPPFKSRFAESAKLARAVRIAKKKNDPDLATKKGALHENLYRNRYVYLIYTIAITIVFHFLSFVISYAMRELVSRTILPLTGANTVGEPIVHAITNYIMEPYVLSVLFGLFAVFFYLKLIVLGRRK